MQFTQSRPAQVYRSSGSSRQIQMNTIDFSPVAVTFQAVGTLLLAIMLAQLSRLFGWRYARLWAVGWLSLFIGLGAVRTFIATQQQAWWLVYLLGDWAFLFLLWSGCRELACRKALDLRLLLYIAPPAVLMASVLIRFCREFNELFLLQAAFITAGSVIAFITLGLMPAERRRTGWQMMRLSLAFFAILYAAYVPLYAIHSYVAEVDFLEYSSLFDLLAGVFLGFAMILVTAEDANRALEEARAQLERALRVDPLTEALSRHAFHSMRSADMVSGVVLMCDVDNLKRINDEIGHAAGDLAIRGAANAIRGVIRADDLLFRWGGDEFVAVVPGLSASVVHERVASLVDGVIATDGTTELRVHLSWGAAEFNETTPLAEAMTIADGRMYEARATRARALAV
ncbi:MAG TPA: GGDEF domain-containing protein [Thermoanaerobaculia bacterium]|nr:GGDEF domain-containing protein [Thermoanaerobaculia bacterium]